MPPSNPKASNPPLEFQGILLVPPAGLGHDQAFDTLDQASSQTLEYLLQEPLPHLTHLLENPTHDNTLAPLPTKDLLSILTEILPSHPLSQALYYYFSDGTYAAIGDIAKHPTYFHLIPKRLLPLLQNTRPGIETNQWLSLSGGVSWNQDRRYHELELSIISILMTAVLFLEPSDPHSMQLWITNQEEFIKQGKGLALHSVRMQHHNHSIWQISMPSQEVFPPHSSIYLQRSIYTNEPSKVLLKSFELDAKRKILWFHGYDQQCAIVKGLLQEKHIPPLTSHPLTYELQSMDHIHSILDQLHENLQKHHFEPLVIPELFSSHNAAPITWQLYFSSKGRFESCFKVPSLDLEIWNLPSWALQLMTGLEHGFLGFLGTQEKSMFSDRKGIRRERDLKVLRHGGFFNLLLVEMGLALDRLLNPKRDTLSSFLTMYSKKAGVLLIEMEKKSGFVDFEQQPILSQLCSSNALNIIERTMIKILHSISTEELSVITHLGTASWRGVYLQIFHFFSLLCCIMMESFDKEHFLKPKFSLFSQFLSLTPSMAYQNPIILYTKSPHYQAQRSEWVHAYQIGNGKMKYSDIFLRFIQAQHVGWELFLDNMPLLLLDVDQLKTEFFVLEAPPRRHLASLEHQSTPHDHVATQNPGTPIDWFELHPEFFFNGVELSATEFQTISQQGILEFGNKVYLIDPKKIPSLVRLEKFWSCIQGTSRMIEKNGKKKMVRKLPKAQTLELLALRALGIPIHGGEQWHHIVQFYDQLSHPRSLMQFPKSICAELKPYQQYGVQWMMDLYALGLGAILADDMGLGKTLQSLSFLETLRTRKDLHHTLIIVPTSLTYNWLSECQKFTPELPIMIFQSKYKEKAESFLKKHTHAAIVATYGLFTEHEAFFKKISWNILIFDEAQNLKNLTSKRTSASRKVPGRFKICLTGTPLENHLGEFYSLVDLVVSGALGDLSSFREKFMSSDTIAPHDLQFLKFKMKPLVLRRTKSEILSELPPKIETTFKLPFEAKQEKIYRDIAMAWNSKVKESFLQHQESKTQLLMLTALLRLRQACSDPGAIPEVQYHQTPPKVSLLLESLQEITESGESALVFTQFLHTFYRIKKQLEQMQIPIFSLHGGTTRVERERNLQAFNDMPKGAVLLMTLKTGGVGLNLVKASYVFHLEPWWNPAVENQATDRAHRIGQTRPVQVYRYLMKESVEEKIELLKDRKTARFLSLFSSVEKVDTLPPIDAAPDGGILLTQADFEYLLS